MDEWPDIKPPREFTGQGFEIIGDPTAEAQITLHFRDGVFDMIEMPRRELPRPGNEDALQKHEQRSEAERLALRLREHPEDHQAKSQLRAIPKDRTAQRTAKEIKAGGPLTDWPFHLRRERAAVIAVMQLSVELNRPPTGAEMVDRMLCLPDALDTMAQPLTTSERKHQVKFLRGNGFPWLEFRPWGI